MFVYITFINEIPVTVEDDVIHIKAPTYVREKLGKLSDFVGTNQLSNVCGGLLTPTRHMMSGERRFRLVKL